MHHAGVPEFAHAGIDDGIAGEAALPRTQGFRVLFPWKGVERRLQVAHRQIRHVEQQVTAELAPADFAEELVDLAREPRVLGGDEMCGVPDLARADFAEPQMRREP